MLLGEVIFQLPEFTVTTASGLLPEVPDLVRVKVDEVEDSRYPNGTEVLFGEKDADETN